MGSTCSLSIKMVRAFFAILPLVIHVSSYVVTTPSYDDYDPEIYCTPSSHVWRNCISYIMAVKTLCDKAEAYGNECAEELLEVGGQDKCTPCLGDGKPELAEYGGARKRRATENCDPHWYDKKIVAKCKCKWHGTHCILEQPQNKRSCKYARQDVLKHLNCSPDQLTFDF